MTLDMRAIDCAKECQRESGLRLRNDPEQSRLRNQAITRFRSSFPFASLPFHLFRNTDHAMRCGASYSASLHPRLARMAARDTQLACSAVRCASCRRTPVWPTVSSFHFHPSTRSIGKCLIVQDVRPPAPVCMYAPSSWHHVAQQLSSLLHGETSEPRETCAATDRHTAVANVTGTPLLPAPGHSVPWSSSSDVSQRVGTTADRGARLITAFAQSATSIDEAG